MLPEKLNQKEMPESQSVYNLEYNIRPKESFHTSSICSCFQCNSINCFKIRNHNSQLSCTCANCKNKKTCTLSHESMLSNETDDKSVYKIIRKNTLEHQNNKSINIHTKSGKSEVELSENIKYNYNDTTLITNKIEKRETSIENSYRRNYSVALSYDQNGEKARNKNSTATLSAQVMNLPFQEFKDSLLLHNSLSSLSSNKLVNPDILTKLKEIYKACSCKVCECITGKPCYPNNDTSSNETCDCGYTNNQNTQFGFKKVPHSGCPCISCDRKDCRGIVKKKPMDIKTCDCRPCDCVKFTESFTKPCDCEPCQCVECNHLKYRLPQSVIIAPVQGNFQQNVCQCEPCECVQCTHNYGAMASSLMREISTGMVTQRNCDCETCLNHSCQLDGADCGCETQNRIMRKPIQRNNRDYDLHRALIGQISFSHKQNTKTKNYDTIAMYALSSNFSKSVFNTPKEERCKCAECECVVCLDIDNHESKIIYKDIHKSLNLLNDSFSLCKCQPCDCQVCSRNDISQNKTLHDTRASNKCICDICECIVCKGLPYCPQNKGIVEFSTNSSKYKSSVHLFQNSNGLNKNISKETFFPLKKGKLLTPSMFEAKILSGSQIKSQSQSCIPVSKKPCKSILKVNGKKSSGKMSPPVSISINHKKSTNKYVDTGYQSCQNIIAPLSNLRNDSYIKTVPRNCESSIAYIHDIKNNLSNSKNSLPNNLSNNLCIFLNNIALNPTTVVPDKSLRIDNEKGTTNIIDSDKSLSTCVDKISKDKLIYNENDTAERYKSTRKCKNRLNDDKDLFNAKIISFEKSISQLKEEVSRNLKTLSEIRSKNEILRNDIVDITNIFDDTICDNLTTKKSRTSIQNINRIDPAKPIKFVEFCEEPDNLIEKYVNVFLVIDQSDDNNHWSILKKGLYLNNPLVRKNKAVCTIPELEMDIKRMVQSISLQTPETQAYNALTKLQLEVNDLLNSPILQSCNKYPKYRIMDRQNIDCKPKSKLDLELKYISSDATSQTPRLALTVEKEVNCNIGQSMEALHRDISLLLDTILTRTVYKSELTRPYSTKQGGRISEIVSVKSSCDVLKASFMGLRKVSDHTVLLRWKKPRDVAEVKGYELQVDGRAVQKILNPTRCMAVLTCLPHCDKLLLTIRTLTASAVPSDHHPAATIVYCPREKHYRYSQSIYVAKELRRC